jgi:hypothetical protein
MTHLDITHRVNESITISDGDTDLFRYVYIPDSPQLESPKPYVHPIRTRSGNVISLFRPHDHLWHKGIAWSLPHLGDQNFWGGPTYVHGSFYVQLDNNGTQRHVDFNRLSNENGTISIVHDLEWITQAGDDYFTERRSLSAQIIDDDTWALVFDSAMTNISGHDVSIGSPTTKGRENAGYGGLFWRGPRSFTGGRLVGPAGAGGDELRGTRSEWLAFVGAHDTWAEKSTILMLDDAANPHHPPKWFARSEEFAALNAAPFFSEELLVAEGETVRFRLGVGFSDGDREQDAGHLADEVRGVLAAVSDRLELAP